MSTKMEQEISEIHKDIEEIKEVLDIVVENYIESLHNTLELDKNKFISLDDYNKKHECGL